MVPNRIEKGQRRGARHLSLWDLSPFILAFVVIRCIDTLVFQRRGEEWNNPIAFLIVVGTSMVLLVLIAAIRRWQTKRSPATFVTRNVESSSGAASSSPTTTVGQETKEEKRKVTPQTATEYKRETHVTSRDESAPGSHLRDRIRATRTSASSSSSPHHHHRQGAIDDANPALASPITVVVAAHSAAVPASPRPSGDRTDRSETHVMYRCPVPGCDFRVRFLRRHLLRRRRGDDDDDELSLLLWSPRTDTVRDDHRWPAVYADQQMKMRGHYVSRHPDISPTRWPTGFAHGYRVKKTSGPSTSEHLERAAAKDKTSSSSSLPPSKRRQEDSSSHRGVSQSPKRRKG